MKKYYSPTKLTIGEGSLKELPKILSKYGKSVLLVTTSDEVLLPLYDEIFSLLKGFDVKHFKDVVANPTVESVDKCVNDINGVDVILAVGGGSSMDTAKASNLRRLYKDEPWDNLFEMFDDFSKEYDALDLIPLVSVPTTSGTGSQMTQATVISQGKDKLTLYHQGLISQEAILDPNLTKTLPRSLTSITAFDTFTHAFESYISPRASLLSKQDSYNAMKLVVNNLPSALENPKETSHRLNLMYADVLGGRGLSNAGAHAPHPLSEIIGGIGNVPHGKALASVYPSFIKLSKDRFEHEFSEIAELFGEKDLYKAINEFLDKIGLLVNVLSLVNEEQFDEIYNHPVWKFLPFGDEEYFKAILTDAK